MSPCPLRLPAGKRVRLDLTPGPVAHNPPAAHQKDHPGWWRGSEMKETQRAGSAARRDKSITHAFTHTDTRTHTLSFTPLTVYSIRRWVSRWRFWIFHCSLLHCQSTIFAFPTSLSGSSQNVNALALTSVQRIAAYLFSWNLSWRDFRAVYCIETDVSIDDKHCMFCTILVPSHLRLVFLSGLLLIIQTDSLNVSVSLVHTIFMVCMDFRIVPLSCFFFFICWSRREGNRSMSWLILKLNLLEQQKKWFCFHFVTDGERLFLKKGNDMHKQSVDC